MTKIREHSFEPGAMSIIQMGEELIGHPTTAINELVKNGYDADADECKVFINHSTLNSFLLVHDNGLGMDHDTLFGAWLQPSVSSKRGANSKSIIYERAFLGSKGIGRLAAMALGEIITVVTKKNNENEFNWISLRREQFREDVLLSKIKFPGDQIDDFLKLFIDKNYLKFRSSTYNDQLVSTLKNNDYLNFKEGTIIIVENLDDSIQTIISDEFEGTSENDLKVEDTSIYRSLAMLETPLHLNKDIQEELLAKKIIDKKKAIAKENNPFQIKFGINLIPNSKNANRIEWIDVNPMAILKGFDYRVIGKVTREGNVEGKFICKRLKEDSFEEKFEIPKETIFDNVIERLKDKKSEKELTEQEFNADAGEYYFDIRVYDRGEEDSLEKLKRLLKTESNTETRDILNKLLGLRISKNGFGVKPYGEEDKDWMGLGQIRVQDPGGNVSTNQILGYLFFYSPGNDGLKEKTNREGFYQNKAFIEVKATLLSILKNIGSVRWRYRQKHNLGRVIKNKIARPDIDSFKNLLNTKEDIKQIRKASEAFLKDVTSTLDNLEESLTLSERLASIGTGVELVYHEMAQPLTELHNAKLSMELKKGKVEPVAVRINFLKDIGFINASENTLNELRDSLKPAIGKSRKEDFKPSVTFRKVCRLFASHIHDLKISIEFNSKAENFILNDLEYAFWISFLNIMNNAVYWLKNADKNRKIIFTIQKNNTIMISNTGPFIPTDDLDIIFNYGVTHRKEKNATGLGLAFTRSILFRNGWEIKAENFEYGPAFLIYKPKEDKDE